MEMQKFFVEENGSFEIRCPRCGLLGSGFRGSPDVTGLFLSVCSVLSVANLVSLRPLR